MTKIICNANNKLIDKCGIAKSTTNLTKLATYNNRFLGQHQQIQVKISLSKWLWHKIQISYNIAFLIDAEYHANKNMDNKLIAAIK